MFVKVFVVAMAIGMFAFGALATPASAHTCTSDGISDSCGGCANNGEDHEHSWSIRGIPLSYCKSLTLPGLLP